jgi:hypothetical protein
LLWSLERYEAEPTTLPILVSHDPGTDECSKPARKSAKEPSAYLTIWPNFTTVRYRGESSQKLKSYLPEMREKTVRIDIWIKILWVLRFGILTVILQLNE